MVVEKQLKEGVMIQRLDFPVVHQVTVFSGANSLPIWENNNQVWYLPSGAYIGFFWYPYKG